MQPGCTAGGTTPTEVLSRALKTFGFTPSISPRQGLLGFTTEVRAHMPVKSEVAAPALHRQMRNPTV